MSNAFTNFLGGVVSGVFNSSADLKDYQHADRLYVRNTYARAPKFGFLFYVVFNINPKASKTDKNKKQDVGLLVKSTTLPTYSISTETLNQYNRKTVIQTGIKYNPVTVVFHDDNSNITTDLWKNYFKYYFADSSYGDSPNPQSESTRRPVAFGDTKYSNTNYAYGLNNYQVEPFFESIDIYVLHQSNFSQYTLINPLVTSWNHDSVSSDEAGKVLVNIMNLAYETVIYKSGKIVKNSKPEGFAAVYYDTTPSPLSVGGNGTNTLFGSGGVLAGAGSVFGTLATAKSPLDYLSAAIQAKTVAKNARSLNKAGLKQEGLSIVTGALRDVQSTGNQPGGARSALEQGLGAAGSVGVNLFSNKNTSINGTTKATPSKLTGGGGG
jgi:hypothetical protein